jgi:uncharacterized protein (TIGR02996 family)
MTTREALFRAVLASPRDMVPQLVLADYLEELGELALAVELRSGPYYRPKYVPECDPTPWVWFRGPRNGEPAVGPHQLPLRVFRRLRPDSGNPWWAEVCGYRDEDAALDDLTMAVAAAWPVAGLAGAG